METETSPILLINSSSSDVDKIIGLLRDTAKIAFDYHHVTTARDVETMLNDRQWDLILSDSAMPGLSPADVILLVQTLQPQTPLIVLAETVMVQDAVEIMRQGARGVVEKTNHHYLVELVRQEIETRRALPDAGKNPATLNRQQTQAKHLKEILDTMQDAVFSLSLPERRLIFASASFESVFGYPLQRILDDADFFKQIVHPDDLEKTVTAMQTGLRDGFAELEHRIVLPDGQVRWLQRQAWVFYDEQDRPIQLNVSARDITRRKQADESLHASEKKYRSLVEGSDASISLVDAEGKYLYVNELAAAPWGISPEQAVDKTPYDFFPPDVAGQIVAAVQTVIASNSTITLEPKEVRGGKMAWFHTSIQPVRDSIGEPYAALIYSNEITEVKHAEQAMLSQNEILRQSQDLIALSDLQGEIIFMNRGGAAMLGSAQPEEFVGRTISYFHLPEDAERILTEALPHALKTGYWRGENRLKTPDGRLIDVDQTIFPIRDSDGQIKQAATIITDTTERKRTEDVIREKEQMFRNLFKSFDVTVAMFDAEGTYLYLNELAAVPFGVSPEDIIGKKLPDLVPPSDYVRQTLADIREVISQGKGKTLEPTALVAGEQRWFRSSIQPVRDANGKAYAALIYVTDITTIKHTELAVRESETRLKHAQSIAHLGSWDWNLKTGEITFSDELYRIFGLEPANTRMTFETLITRVHPDDRKAVEKSLQGTRESGISSQLEARIILPDGEIRWGLGQSEAILDNQSNPTLLTGTFLDITGQKESSLALKRAAHRLDILHTIDQAILRADTLEAVAQSTLDRVTQLVPCSRATVITMDVENLSGYIVAIRFAGKQTTVPAGQTYKLSPALVKELVEERYVLIDDLLDQPADYMQKLHDEGIRSILSIGLKQQEQLIGVFNLHGPSKDFFSEEYIHIALEVADQLAIGIHTHQLNEKIRQYNAELEARVARRTTELERAKTRVEAILNSSSSGILLVNREHGIQQANPAFHSMMGCTDDMCYGKSLELMIDPDHYPRFATAIEAVMAQDSIEHFETRVQRFDGTTFDAAVGLAPVTGFNSDEQNLVCTIRDISEIKKVEHNLRDSEQMLTSILENIPVRVFWKDRDSVIQGCNTAYAQAIGLASRDDIVGMRDAEINAELAPEWVALDQRVMKTGEPVINKEDLVTWGYPPMRWERLSKVPLRNADNAIIGVMVVSEDITERKQAELAIAEERNLLRTLIDAIPESIYVKDSEHKFVLSNLAHAQVRADGNPVEMIGKTDFDLFPAELAEQLRAEEARIMQTDTPLVNSERLVLLDDGRQQWTLSTKVPLKSVDGEIMGLVGITRDITERKAIEQQLRFDASIQASVSDAVIVTDMQGHIQSWNKAAERIYGWCGEEAVGKPIVTFLHTQFEGLSAEQVEQSFTEHGTWHGEMRQTHKDGHWMTVQSAVSLFKDEKGAPVGIVSINRDITDRKQAEDALRESEERYRLLAENVTDAIAKLTPDGIRTFVTPSCFGLLGYTPDELVGHPTFDIVHPDDRSKSQDLMRQALASDTVSLTLTHRVLRKDGRSIWVEISITIVRDAASGQPVEIIGIMHDITERKKAEDALREYADEVHDLYNNAPCGYHSLDADGIIVQINDTELHWLGYTREEVVGKLHFTDLLMAESLTTFHSNFPVFRSQGWISDLQFTFKRKDGSAFTGLLSATAVMDENGKYLQSRSTLFDITQLRKAQNALRDSEAQLRSLVESQTAYMIRTDLEGNYVFCNQAYLDDFGWIAEQAGELSSANTVIAEDHPKVEAAAQASIAAHDKPVQVMLRKPAQDGRVRHTLWEFIAIKDRTGVVTGVQCMGFDITKQHEAEEALRDSEERYRTVVNTMSEGIILQRQGGFIETCNAAAEHILGLTLDQMMGRTLTDPRWQTIHEDGTDFPRETYPAIVSLKTGESQFNVVMGVHKPDGSLNWILINSQPLFEPDRKVPYAVVATFTDITSRKQAEDDLVALSQRLQLATETGGIGIWDWDVVDDTLIWDEQMFSLYGIVPSQFSGKAMELWSAGLLHPDDQVRMQNEMVAMLAGEKLLDTEFRVVLSGGDLRYLKGRAMMFLDAAGKPVRVVGVNWDITLLKQAEENLRQALKKEKELGELKSRFVSTASHEFRTPLAAILAVTETLTVYRERMDNAQIAARLDKIRQQVNHMKDIMEDVLELARMQAGHLKFNPAPGDLDILCRDVIKEFASQSDFRERIVYDCHNPPVATEFDTRRLRQVVSNLIHNALKYSNADKSVFVTLSQDENQVTLQVKDDGIGIPTADLQHLFVPFNRASNVGAIPGTGLGLSITKEAVEAHGGEITVTSLVELGTTFTVVIPKISVQGDVHDEDSDD